MSAWVVRRPPLGEEFVEHYVNHVRVLKFGHVHKTADGWEVRGYYDTETEAAIARDHSKYKDRILIVRLTGEVQV